MPAADTLSKSFEAPLKEFVRAVKAVKKVVADRSAALATFQQVRAAPCRAWGFLKGKQGSSPAANGPLLAAAGGMGFCV